MMQSVACNALHRAEERCARWLLATHDRAGDKIIHLTQESLAEMLGVQRTTVTAVTGVLAERGLIRTRRGRVEVLDRDGLERAACECYRAVEDHFARLLPEVGGVARNPLLSPCGRRSAAERPDEAWPGLAAG